MAILVVHADRAEYDRTVPCDRCGLIWFKCETVRVGPCCCLCPECFAQRPGQSPRVVRKPPKTEQFSGIFSPV